MTVKATFTSLIVPSVTAKLLALGFLLFANGCPKPAPTHDAESVAAGMKAKMKLPVDVDADTQLDDVRANSKTELGYFLTLTRTTKATLDPNLAKQMETILRGGACSNPAYATILKAGISVSLAYRTQDHADVTRIVIAPKDCGL